MAGAPLGNDNAKKGAIWRAALDRAIAQDDGKRLRQAAEILLDLASTGEAWAINHLADRLDGKPAQSVAVSGDGQAPLLAKIMMELVRSGINSQDTGEAGIPPSTE